MSIELLRARAVPFALPLRTRFRGITERIGVLIPGPRGWGEFAPFADYDDAAAARWLHTALEAAYEPWPALVRTSVPVNAIIPAVGPEAARAIAAHAVDVLGCTTIKCKVGDVDDAARLAAVRSVLPDGGRIRLDVNAGWSVADAVTFWERHGGSDIEYLEQPVRTLTELAALRSQIDARIALDESIRWDPDAAGADLAEFGDVAIIKVAPLGGVVAALDVAARIGLPVVVSGSLDSSVGLAPALACAGALPVLAGACGLGTGELFAADLTEPGLVPRDGALPVVHPQPDMAQLATARARIDAQQRERILDQLTRAWWHGPADIWAERIGKDA